MYWYTGTELRCFNVVLGRAKVSDIEVHGTSMTIDDGEQGAMLI